MKVWILSIVGVIFLSVMLDIVCPEGKTNIFIKSIFVLMFMYVILLPIIKLIKNTDMLDLTKYLNVVEIDIRDTDEFEQIINELEIKIQEYVSENGIGGVVFEISGNVSKNNVEIKEIKVDLSNTVLNEENVHIDKYKLITKLIMDMVEVGEEQIVYG